MNSSQVIQLIVFFNGMFLVYSMYVLFVQTPLLLDVLALFVFVMSMLLISVGIWAMKNETVGVIE